MTSFRKAFLAAAVTSAALIGPAAAADIMAEWENIKAPPAPKLESVSVDAKTTAFLVLDLNIPICDPVARPRCKESIVPVQKFLQAARAKKMMVLYTTGGGRQANDIIADIKPEADETVITGAGSDKFYNSALEKTLKDKGIKTVVIVGAASNGAVLFTSTAAVRRDFAVIAPVDGSSGDGGYAEQFTAYELANSPGQVGKIKLTKTTMITIE